MPSPNGAWSTNSLASKRHALLLSIGNSAVVSPGHVGLVSPSWGSRPQLSRAEPQLKPGLRVGDDSARDAWSFQWRLEKAETISLSYCTHIFNETHLAARNPRWTASTSFTIRGSSVHDPHSLIISHHGYRLQGVHVHLWPNQYQEAARHLL